MMLRKITQQSQKITKNKIIQQKKQQQCSLVQIKKNLLFDCC